MYKSSIKLKILLPVTDMKNYHITVTLPEEALNLIKNSPEQADTLCSMALQSGFEPDNLTFSCSEKNIRIAVGQKIYERLNQLSYHNKKYINFIAGEIIIKYLISRLHYED